MIDWDAYRAAYDRMTYAEVAAFHRRVWDAYPEQSQHSPRYLRAFFDGLLSGWPVRVVELGGWRGEAAAEILPEHPSIRSWTNYELCEPAVRAPVVADPRYIGVFPDRWPWELFPATADVAVLAHVIEHMQAEQLERLVGWLRASGVRAIYVESPLRERVRSWRGSTSAHLLRLGWSGVVALFLAAGFDVRERHSYAADRHVVIFGAAA